MSERVGEWDCRRVREWMSEGGLRSEEWKKICENTELRRQSKINKETWIFKHLSSVRARWRSTKRNETYTLSRLLCNYCHLNDAVGFCQLLADCIVSWGCEIECFSFPYLSPVILCLCHFAWLQSRRANKIIHLSSKSSNMLNQPNDYRIHNFKIANRSAKSTSPRIHIFELNFFVKFIYTS